MKAVGGLAAAAVGGAGVFVIGAMATLGVASAAAALLGAPSPPLPPLSRCRSPNPKSKTQNPKP